MFRINAAGELINVAEYEHDPSSLSGFPVPESRKIIKFPHFRSFITLFCDPRVGSPPMSKYYVLSS